MPSVNTFTLFSVAIFAMFVFFGLPYLALSRTAVSKWKESRRAWKWQTITRSLITLTTLVLGAAEVISTNAVMPRVPIVWSAIIIAAVLTYVDYRILRADGQLDSAPSGSRAGGPAWLRRFADKFNWFPIYMIYMNTLFAVFLLFALTNWPAPGAEWEDWFVAIVMVLALFAIRETWQKVSLPAVERISKESS